MPRKTYSEISKELTNSRTAEKNLKKQVSKHREEALKYKHMARSLPIQYERVIKDLKQSLDEFAKNSWKLVFIIVAGKINARWKQLRGR